MSRQRILAGALGARGADHGRCDQRLRRAPRPPPPTSTASQAAPATRQTAHASLRLDIRRTKAWVGQAVPVTLQAYFRGAEGVTLEGAPQLTSAGIFTSDLAREPLQATEMIGGEPVLVATWTGTVTPSSAAPLVIVAELPVRIRYREAAPRSRAGEPLRGRPLRGARRQSLRHVRHQPLLPAVDAAIDGVSRPRTPGGRLAAGDGAAHRRTGCPHGQPAGVVHGRHRKVQPEGDRLFDACSGVGAGHAPRDRRRGWRSRSRRPRRRRHVGHLEGLSAEVDARGSLQGKARSQGLRAGPRPSARRRPERPTGRPDVVRPRLLSLRHARNAAARRHRRGYGRRRGAPRGERRDSGVHSRAGDDPAGGLATRRRVRSSSHTPSRRSE